MPATANLRGSSSLATVFDPRANSIGFLRVALASLVLFSHSFALGGFAAHDPIVTLSQGTTSASFLAVEGFFVLSGYLIVRSFLTAPSILDYLWRRSLRIFPGYWVCLVVTAVVFAPLAYASEHGGVATLLQADWLGAGETPLGYVRHNALLVVHQWNIWHLFSTTPLASHQVAPLSFNGSLWTLRYEFECYLLVAALGLSGLLRHRRVALVVLLGWATVLWGILVVAHVDPAALSNLPRGVGLRGLTSDPERIRFWLMFALGGCLFLAAQWIPMRRAVALSIGAVLVGSVAVGSYPLVGRLAFAYVCLWLAVALPIRHFDARGDFSYGIYIYAFPVQQLLALAGAPRWGWGPYVGLTIVGTMLCAVPSWFLVEAPAQTLKRYSPMALFRRALGRLRVLGSSISGASPKRATWGLDTREQPHPMPK